MTVARFRLASLVVALLLSAGACGGTAQESQKAGQQPAAQSSTGSNQSSAPASSSTPAATATSGLKAALLLSGPYNDHGWNELGYNSLMQIKQELGAQVAYTENVSQSDQASDFRGYAAQGYNLIIGHGFEFADAAKQVAPSFPKTWFAVTSATVSQSPNVTSLNTNTWQQGYLAGAIAALLSKKGTIGAIGGQSIPPITNALDGFKAGAAAVRPGVNVLTSMTDSFTDVAKAKEFALAMIQKGADVLMGDADQAGLGVIDAAKQDHLTDIGMDSDEHSVVPDTIPVSVIQNYGAAWVALAKKVGDGTVSTTPFSAGVQEGAILLSPWYGDVPADVKTKVDDVVNQMKAGALQGPGH